MLSLWSIFEVASCRCRTQRIVPASSKMYKYTQTHAASDTHTQKIDNKTSTAEHMRWMECILFSVQFAASIQSLVVRSRPRVFFFFVSVIFFAFSFNQIFIRLFHRIQNFRLHHNDSHVNQCFEVHRINRMFNNGRPSNCGGGNGVESKFNPNPNPNSHLKRLENGRTDATPEEIPNENNISLSSDKNSNRELFTMDSLNRNSLSGNWWVTTPDDTRSYFYSRKLTRNIKNTNRLERFISSNDEKSVQAFTHLSRLWNFVCDLSACDE